MFLSSHPAIPPTTETISWTTQVINAYDGREERHVVRLKPRYSYRVTHPLISRTEVDAMKRREDLIRDNLQIVLWHAAYTGSARLATIRGHPWWFEFDRLVGHLTPDLSLTISNTVRGSGAVYPVLEGIIHGNISYNIRKGGGKATVTYNVEQAVEPVQPLDFPTIRVGGKDYLLLDMPTRSGFTQAVTQNQSYFDSVVGAYIGTTRWDRPKLQWSYTVELFSPDQVLAWKQFLFRCQGRFSPVALRDTDGRVVIMRLSTDAPVINHALGYSTSTVSFTEVFV